MQGFIVSTGVVTLAEIGDKTQLLSLVLAARYRKPWPICIGILLATIANHALAGIVGDLLESWLSPDVLHWIIVISLALMAAWVLVPDKLDADAAQPRPHHGIILTTIVAFFLAEMGDKTQVATVVLAAQYSPLWQVVAGTTAGMLLANVPVIWLGSRFAHKLPLKATRTAAALLFAALAVWVAIT